MSEALFPSGPWTGFYKYSGQTVKHRMELHLEFANGRLTGEGIDDIGRFYIRGHYDARELECYWTKTYVGAHDVYYRGFREGKGIWGTWEIGLRARGGFHIWPKGAEEGETEEAAAQEPAPAQVVEPAEPVRATEELVGPAARLKAASPPPIWPKTAPSQCPERAAVQG